MVRIPNETDQNWQLTRLVQAFNDTVLYLDMEQCHLLATTRPMGRRSPQVRYQFGTCEVMSSAREQPPASCYVLKVPTSCSQQLDVYL